MGLKDTLKKYESLLKQDRYDDIFNRCSSSERRDMLDFLYNMAGVDVLTFMTSIPNQFFADVPIKSITIPNNVKSIGAEAFAGTDIESVYISDSVTDMGVKAFKNCINLKTVRLSKNLEKIPNEAFAYCLALDKVFLPDSVKFLGKEAFAYCANDLIIVANYRSDPADKIKFLGDQTFYRNHLKFKRKG